MEMDDPFVYKKPEWLVLEEREKRREELFSIRSNK